MEQDRHNTALVDNVSDSCLDPCSPSFNPLSALNATFTNELYKVEPLPSLKAFEEYISDPEAYFKQQEIKKQKDDIKRDAKLKAEQLVKESDSMMARKKVVKNVLTRMERIEGPTACLRKWMQSRCKVTVITRSFKGIRGSCTGFIVAFDKYMNMAMVDVDEVYFSISRQSDKIKNKRGSKLTTSKEPSAAESLNKLDVELLTKRVESLHITKCNNIKQRHIRQLFVRGDNIVSINYLEPP